MLLHGPPERTSSEGELGLVVLIYIKKELDILLPSFFGQLVIKCFLLRLIRRAAFRRSPLLWLRPNTVVSEGSSNLVLIGYCKYVQCSLNCVVLDLQV